jgi:hypothetical protein
MKKAHHTVRLFLCLFLSFFGSIHGYLLIRKCTPRKFFLEIKSFCIHLFDTDFDKLVYIILFFNKSEYMEIS